jgi:hypothetical protein
MTKKNEQDPQSNTPNLPCFANNHMSPEEFGFWNICRSLSHDSGVLYAEAKMLKACFSKMGHNRPYRLCKTLQAAGWFKLLKAPTRRPNGTQSSAEYRVLSHDEWAKEYPGKCHTQGCQTPDGRTKNLRRSPSEVTVKSDRSPSEVTDTTSNRSPNEGAPIINRGSADHQLRANRSPSEGQPITKRGKNIEHISLTLNTEPYVERDVESTADSDQSPIEVTGVKEVHKTAPVVMKVEDNGAQYLFSGEDLTEFTEEQINALVNANDGEEDWPTIMRLISQSDLRTNDDETIELIRLAESKGCTEIANWPEIAEAFRRQNPVAVLKAEIGDLKAFWGGNRARYADDSPEQRHCDAHWQAEVDDLEEKLWAAEAARTTKAVAQQATGNAPEPECKPDSNSGADVPDAVPDVAKAITEAMTAMNEVLEKFPHSEGMRAKLEKMRNMMLADSITEDDMANVYTEGCMTKPFYAQQKAALTKLVDALKLKFPAIAEQVGV